MIQIILYLTIGLLFTILDLIFIRRNRRILVWLSTFVFHTLFINGLIIGLLLLFLGKPNALKTNMYHTFFAVEYGVLASGIGIALLIVHAILMHRLTFARSSCLAYYFECLCIIITRVHRQLFNQIYRLVV